MIGAERIAHLLELVESCQTVRGQRNNHVLFKRSRGLHVVNNAHTCRGVARNGGINRNARERSLKARPRRRA